MVVGIEGRGAEIRAEAEDFCRSLAPLLEADPDLRTQGMPSDGDSREVYRRMGEAGWIGVHWPRELGGRGLSFLETALVEEVFGYHWLPLSGYLLSCRTVGNALLRFGSRELVETLIPRICHGELLFCQGFSEPEAGSDLASLKTTAREVPGGFVLKGHKIWTSSAHIADWIYLAARTDPQAPKHRGLTVFVLPLRTPGITVRTFPTMGGGLLAEVFLDDVFVPASAQVGARNEGWAVMLYTLDFERVTIEKVGALRWILDALEEILRERDPSGSWRWTLWHLRGGLEAARQLCYRAAAGLARGEPASVLSAMAKLAVGRLTRRIAGFALDLLGVPGLAEAGPYALLKGRAAALYRAAVGSTLSGGTAEIQRLVIARRGLKCPKE